MIVLFASVKKSDFLILSIFFLNMQLSDICQIISDLMQLGVKKFSPSGGLLK